MKKNSCIVIIILCILSGCGLTGGETIPPSTGIYIINASPDAPALDVLLNSTTIASGYTYGKDSGYFLNFPGTYELSFKQTNTVSNIADQLLNLPAGKYYSLYFVDSFSMLKALFIEDKITADTFSYAKVRLLNFSPNSPVLDASFTNSADTITFTDRYFNDQSVANSTKASYTAFPSGTYKLSLYQPDTSILIKDFITINFETGTYYTVYLKGLYENAATPLDTAIIRH